MRHSTISVLAITAFLTIGAASAAHTQQAKAIYTASQFGAYHSSFCPPILVILESAGFHGYSCTPSGGTLDNIAKVLADPLLQPLFGEGQPHHVEHLTWFTAESFGGPDRFTRELGFDHLVDVHRGLGITDEQRERFVALYLPLSRPALATSAVFAFLGSWDEYSWAFTTIVDPDKQTLPLAIAQYQGQHSTAWGLVFAASLIGMVQ